MPKTSEDSPTSLSFIINKITKSFYLIKDIIKKLIPNYKFNKENKYFTKNKKYRSKRSRLLWQHISQGAENFVHKTVKDIMVPKSSIIAISYDANLQELNHLVNHKAYTRTLVYKNNLDNIIGFVHVKDLFQLATENKTTNIMQLIRKHIVAPSFMSLLELLSQMQKLHTHIAVVVDEYGCTQGLVTIEDLVKEVFGEISDEHDDLHKNTANEFKVLRPGLVITNALVEIEKLEQELGVKLQDTDESNDTIGGLIISKVGHIPKQGDIIYINNGMNIEVLQSTPRALQQLKIIYDAKHISTKH